MSAAIGRRICKVPIATVLAILMTALFALYSILPAVAITPDGVQCPTAPVQKVTVLTINCCGKLACTTRAPKPGDNAFVQCRCAEKSASAQKTVVQAKVQPYFVNAILSVHATAIPEFRQVYLYQLSYSSIKDSPSTKPPIQV